jgi:hypothetical protein
MQKKIITNESTRTATRVPTGILQRKCDCGQYTIACSKCSACSEECEGRLERSALSRDSKPPVAYDALNPPGQPIDAVTRAFMEPRFGHDLQSSAPHTDVRAAESAQTADALALLN